MFQGSLVALVTPMLSSGELDIPGLKRLLDFHLTHETDGIVVVGTTGEAATLTEAEQLRVTETTLKHVGGKIPVIVGTGTNDTQKTIKLTQQARQAGANACLIVTPYYNKPTQEGLYRHYMAIADAVAIPQILYNVPGRTACDLLPETVQRLANHPMIVGIKEATGNIDRARAVMPFANDEFIVLSGDDKTALDLVLVGAKGVISVTANVAPRQMHAMMAAGLAGQTTKARSLDEPLQALHRDLFVESNPIPTKWALHEMGFIDQGIRLPLTPLAAKHQETVRTALKVAGIIKP